MSGFYEWFGNLFVSKTERAKLSAIDRIQKLSEKDAKVEAEDLIKNFGVPEPIEESQLRILNEVPSQIREFFSKYVRLCFDANSCPLDRALLTEVKNEDDKKIIIIGNSSDEGLYNAVFADTKSPSVFEVFCEEPINGVSKSVPLQVDITEDSAGQTLFHFILLEKLINEWSKTE